jgi:hypothetical protein
MKRWLLAICSLFIFSAGTYAQLLSEDFEGGIPADWQISTLATDGGWNSGTAADLGSAYWTFDDNGSTVVATNDDDCNCDKSMDYLITPELDFTDLSGPVLIFDINFAGGTYQGSTEVATIEVSLDGGTTWELVETLDGSGTTAWGTEEVALVAYAGQPSVHIGFHYNDGGGWLFGLAIDNVSIGDLPGKDISVTALGFDQFHETGATVDITGTVVNNGAEEITSFDLTWSDGTNDYTETFSGVSIPTFGSYDFTHGTTFSPADAVSYNIEVSASNPNGGMDENMDDNSQSGVVSGVSFIPTKRVVAEEATGTWCPWCPRGTIFMDSMTNQYQDLFVGIAVHNADPMVVTEYDDGLTDELVSAFPSVVIDRNSVIDPSAMVSAVPQALTRISPVSVGLDGQYDESNRVITYTVDAEFVTQLAGVDYRINGIITEDGVTGTGASWAQANAYAGGGFGQMGGYENLPNPVPAEDMVYDHVGRALMAGWDGQPSSVPADLSAGDVASHTFTYDVPADYDTDNMHVIGLVINNATGEVLNAISTKLSEFTVVSNEEVEQAFTTFNVMPTLTSTTSQLNVAFEEACNVEIYVFNSNGQLIATDLAENVMNHMFEINLTNQAAGTYFVNVTVDGQSRVATIVKQ